MKKNKNLKKEKKKRRAETWIKRKLDIMMGIPQTARDQRAFTAEDIGLRAAQYWQKKKVIKKARRTTHFSPEDLAKKDIVIEHLDGREMAIDIKTYWDSEKEKECREKGVFLLPIRPGGDEKRVREKMLGLIILDLISGLKMEQIREVISGIIKKKEEKRRAKPEGLVKRIIKKFQRGDS